MHSPPPAGPPRSSLFARFGLLGITFLSGCGSIATQEEVAEDIGQAEQAATTAPDPVAICNQDPRVWSGLVSLQVCVGARLFFDETFNGNGRTCGSCHPAANNFTIDNTFLSTLANSDPLFVAENPAFQLAGLETTALREMGLIRENVDGFDNLDHKFVLRSVPHLFSMATSIVRDPTDGTSAAFTERTGWSGDGVDGGALRDFANGAIKQHFPKDLGRTEGVSFRSATQTELSKLADFQLALGRKNELNIENIRLSDSFAEQGRLDFIDPQVGRCNECHKDAGANSKKTGKNANFATGIEIFGPILDSRAVLDGVEIFDGGFGGQGLASPNIAVNQAGLLDGFGDGSFSPPPLVEAADTGPFFHHNNLGSEGQAIGMPGAVAFYASDAFNDSPAGQALVQEFGTRVTLPGNSIVNIGAFLRVLNIAFNLDLAKQRLAASKKLNVEYWDYRKDLQLGLLSLATEEIADALRVLASPDGPPLHTSFQAPLNDALAKLAQARATTAAGTRISLTQDALNLIATVRTGLGTNIQFDLGAGNLMF